MKTKMKIKEKILFKLFRKLKQLFKREPRDTKLCKEMFPDFFKNNVRGFNEHEQKEKF